MGFILRKIRVNYHCSAIPGEGIPEILCGGVTRIKCDVNGIPLNRYWFRRFIDSTIDKCITFLDEQEIQAESRVETKLKPKTKKKVSDDE